MRTRYLYTQNGVPLEQPIEVGADWRQPDSGRTLVVTDLYMDGVRATDGTDIGSRKKRRAYMQANNLADADDFKNTWAKAEQERQALTSGRWGVEERREDLRRAMHNAQRRRR
jgi:hypothetical protein